MSPDCDHSIILIEGQIYTISNLINSQFGVEQFCSILDSRKSGRGQKLQFCPYCGEKIKWDKLKKFLIAVKSCMPKQETKLTCRVNYLTVLTNYWTNTR